MNRIPVKCCCFYLDQSQAGPFFVRDSRATVTNVQEPLQCLPNTSDKRLIFDRESLLIDAGSFLNGRSLSLQITMSDTAAPNTFDATAAQRRADQLFVGMILKI